VSAVFRKKNPVIFFTKSEGSALREKEKEKRVSLIKSEVSTLRNKEENKIGQT
jgi:hypothetical protein